jgi:HAD superfamily hydrolase (TIGR01509 family)
MKLCDYEAFIFDLDGTIIDSEKYHARAFADAVLAQSGYRLTPDEHLEFFGKHSAWFAQELNTRHDLSLDPDGVRAHKQSRVREIFEARPFSGAREFLDRWFGKKPMALATNSPLEFVQPALEKAGLLGLFDPITTSDEITHRKPDPEIIERTVQKLRSDPLKTLVFEDQLIGIQAARSAGTQVVAVDNGQSVDFPSDVDVHTWRELLIFSGAQE